MDKLLPTLIPPRTVGLAVGGVNVLGLPVTLPQAIVSCPPTCNQVLAPVSNQIFLVSVAIYIIIEPVAVGLALSTPCIIFLGVNPKALLILEVVNSSLIVAELLFSTFPNPTSLLVVLCGLVPLPGCEYIGVSVPFIFIFPFVFDFSTLVALDAIPSNLFFNAVVKACSIALSIVLLVWLCFLVTASFTATLKLSSSIKLLEPLIKLTILAPFNT